jgi:hypothetical protein
MSKITDEDLKEISDLRTKINEVIGESGQLFLQIKLLEEDVKSLKDTLEQQTAQFKKFIVDEQNLVKRLSEKYGVGSINFETGEFTPEK